MLNLMQSMLLGIIQGITEWLPISSSGHLVLMQKLMNLQVPVAFDIMLHFASLIVIIIFFRKEITNILISLARWDTKSGYFRLAILIILGNILTALIVFPLKDTFEKAFSSLLAVGICFIFTGILLFFSERRIGNEPFSIKSSAIAGIAQGLAFLPGISRSGSTISAALLSGIKKEEAFRFSFLLAIPAIAGASILEINEIISSTIPLAVLSAGFIASFAVSFIALYSLKRIIMNRNLHYFSYYCFAIGLITLAMHFLSKS